MNESLRRRYALLLRAYPASWRVANAEETLTTLDEVSTAGRRWPAMREARSLVVNGWRTRVRANVPSDGRIVADAVIPAVLL